MSLEGSTPLSQNPEGNTAAAISDLNDNFNISQSSDKSITQQKLRSYILQCFHKLFISLRSLFIIASKTTGNNIFSDISSAPA